MTYVMMDYMALELILLSVLRSSPAHGYELKRRVQRPTFARLSNNSLYPYLRRFEAAGAVTSVLEEQEGKPARRVYSITDAGRRLFLDLVSTLPPDLAGNDEEFLVRLSFFTEIDPAARSAILAARAQVMDARIAQVRTLKDEAIELPEWRAIAMEHLLDQLGTERAWLDTLETQSLREQKSERDNHDRIANR